jgi:hypothetical protein
MDNFHVRMDVKRLGYILDLALLFWMFTPFVKWWKVSAGLTIGVTCLIRVRRNRV